jgi:putative membrane protein
MKNEILNLTSNLTASPLVAFVVYIITTLIILATFMFLYSKITPTKEKHSLANNKLEPIISMLGAMFGFLFPLLSASYYSASLLDYFYWATVAGIVQIVIYFVVYKLIHRKYTDDNMAVAVLHAGLAIALGLVNAFSLIPM